MSCGSRGILTRAALLLPSVRDNTHRLRSRNTATQALAQGAAYRPYPFRGGRLSYRVSGIVKLTQKIARLCSKERTIGDFGLSRGPVFSLSSPPQLASRGRRLRAIFH